MNKEIFGVFDQAAARFLEPFFAPTVEAGIRAFRSVVTRDGHQFGKYPEDYALFHLGTFEAESGAIGAFEPRKVSMAVNFVQAASAEPLKAVPDA